MQIVEGAGMNKGAWAKRSVVAAVCVSVAMVATPSSAEQSDGESYGTGQLEFNLDVGALINGRPSRIAFQMGDAQTTGARYLDPATPPIRVQAPISGSEHFSIKPSLVKLKRKPRNSFYLPTEATLWKWIRGERMPIEVTSMSQCAGPWVSGWDCFPSNQNRNAGFDLPGGEENSFYTQWESPNELSMPINRSGSTREMSAAVVFADSLGSTVWTTMKLRSPARWISTEGPLSDGNRDGQNRTATEGTENLYSAVQKGVYVGPELPIGGVPRAISRSGGTASTTVGAWELPANVQFHDRTLLAFDCKGKKAGQEKKGVLLEEKFGCTPLGVAPIPNQPGKYEIPLAMTPRSNLVIEDWLSVRGKRFEKGQIPSIWIQGERDIMSGLTMQERELYIDQIPPMRFVTRAAVS